MKYPPRDFSLENAVKAVKQVLTENPEGLQISQLSGLARLSANSTKKALNELKAEQDGDIWFLPADPKAKPEPLPEPVPTPAPRPEPVEITKADVQDLPAAVVAQKLAEPAVSNGHVPILQRVKKAFEDNPAGLTAAEIMKIADCTNDHIRGSIGYIRKTWFRVDLKIGDDDIRRYIPGEAVIKAKPIKQVEPKIDTPVPSLNPKAPSIEPDPVTTASADVCTQPIEDDPALSEPAPAEPISCTVMQEPTKNIQEHEEIMLPDAEFIHEKAENIQTEPVATAEQQSDIVAKLKAQLKAKQTIPISRSEIEEVLKEAFGFDEVQWNHASGRMTGVTLSREVSLSHD